MRMAERPQHFGGLLTAPYYRSVDRNPIALWRRGSKRRYLAKRKEEEEGEEEEEKKKEEEGKEEVDDK